MVRTIYGCVFLNRLCKLCVSHWTTVLGLCCDCVSAHKLKARYFRPNVATINNAKIILCLTFATYEIQKQKKHICHLCDLRSVTLTGSHVQRQTEREAEQHVENVWTNFFMVYLRIRSVHSQVHSDIPCCWVVGNPNVKPQHQIPFLTTRLLCEPPKQKWLHSHFFFWTKISFFFQYEITQSRISLHHKYHRMEVHRFHKPNSWMHRWRIDFDWMNNENLIRKRKHWND